MKVFLNSSWWQALKKWVKVAVCIFKENSYFPHSGAFAQSGNIFGPKSTKIQNFNKVFSLNFFKILSDDRYVKGSEKDFFLFFRTVFIMPKEPCYRCFWVQNWLVSHFLFQCFLFPDSFNVKFKVPLLLHFCFIIITITALCTGHKISYMLTY